MDVTGVFIGIDVACAKGKRLPMCFARSVEGRLEPLELPRTTAQLIPRGLGNIAVRDALPFVEAANGTATAIQAICKQMGWTVERIAIDAPAEPSAFGQRRCELALIEAGLSVFKTPSRDAWRGVLETCRAHLDSGAALARLPYANKIWMLYGFKLFAALRRTGFSLIEVYPFAIMHALLGEHPHKSTAEGYGLQLDVIARCTKWKPSELHARLRGAVGGSQHDRLDAFAAAWLASLPCGARQAYGNSNDDADAIWVPITKNAHRL